MASGLPLDMHMHKGQMMLIPVAERSKVRVCSHSLAGISGANPTGDIDVCLL